MPGRGAFAEVIQSLEHAIPGGGVLIGAIEHHAAGEYFAVPVAFSFAGRQAGLDMSDSSVQVGLPCLQFGLFLLQDVKTLGTDQRPHLIDA